MTTSGQKKQKDHLKKILPQGEGPGGGPHQIIGHPHQAPVKHSTSFLLLHFVQWMRNISKLFQGGTLNRGPLLNDLVYRQPGWDPHKLLKQRKVREHFRSQESFQSARLQRRRSQSSQTFKWNSFQQQWNSIQQQQRTKISGQRRRPEVAEQPARWEEQLLQQQRSPEWGRAARFGEWFSE